MPESLENIAFAMTLALWIAKTNVFTRFFALLVERGPDGREVKLLVLDWHRNALKQKNKIVSKSFGGGGV